MRIVSQSGMIDLPYDKVGISIHANDGQLIIAYGIDENDDNFWEIARYSTPQKAEKALKMLRNAYYEIERERIYRDGVSYLTTHFQFPVDSEIEV